MKNPHIEISHLSFLTHKKLWSWSLRIFIKLFYNHGHNILRLFDVLPNFHSSQVKRSAIISNKHDI